MWFFLFRRGKYNLSCLPAQAELGRSKVIETGLEIREVTANQIQLDLQVCPIRVGERCRLGLTIAHQHATETVIVVGFTVSCGVPEPAFAERGRTLMYLGRIGSLSTLSRKQPGFPFGSVMPYGLDDHGRPIFLISTMAMHTQNLQADARASLLVTQDDTGGDPLGASRVTLVGNVLPLTESEVAEARVLSASR